MKRGISSLSIADYRKSLEAAHAPPAEQDGLSLVNKDWFKAKLSIRSDSRFYELSRVDPAFPRPVIKSRRFTRWLRREVDLYVLVLVERRDQKVSEAAA